MVQNGTKLKVIDNSGARIVTCIGNLGGFKKKYASFGNIITVVIKTLRNNRRLTAKIKKGQICKALIIRSLKAYKTYSSTLYFFENSVILLSNQHKLIGTRIFGAVPIALRKSKYLRITFLTLGLIL